MSTKEQQILNPKKLKAARFASRLKGTFRPSPGANAPINKQNIKKILVQEHQCIGDVLMLEPALAAIREGFPLAEVTLLCVPSVKDLAIRAGLADQILAYPDEDPMDESFDLVFDFHGDIRRLKHLMNYESRLFAGFSFSGGARWLTHVIDYPYEEHQVERPFALLKAMGVPVNRKTPAIKGFDSPGGKRQRILLHPGANHEARTWPWEHWLDLIALLKEDKQDLIWVIPPGDTAPAGVEVFSGDLVALAELCASSAMLVGCDSMSVHLAAALGTPALAIFGSQDPELTKPYGPEGYVIMPEEECRHRKLDWRLCKECMKAVKPTEVFTKINSILTK
jgi:ADP-heptose:LPS heptosyltransferase